MSRITKDEECVKSLMEMFESIWINPLHSQALDLCNISTGATPGDDVVTDLLNAKEMGKQAHNESRIGLHLSETLNSLILYLK